MRSFKRFSVVSWPTLSFLLLLGTLFASTANAQLVSQITHAGTVCGGDLVKYGNCTAGEISVSNVTNTIFDNPWEADQTCVRGETITALTTTVSYEINTQKRYDLLMWIGEQEGTDPRTAVAGDPAQSCIVMSMPGPFPGGTNNNVFVDLEGNPGDQCGDINGAAAATTESRTYTNVSFECQDNDADLKADIQLLLTWSQNTNQSCGEGTGESFPSSGAGSKCDFEILNTTLDIVEPASLTIIKDTLGGDDQFAFGFNQTLGGTTGTTITTVAGTGSFTYSNLAAVSGLNITETFAVAGWDATDITCTGATNNGTFVDDINNPAINGIDIAAGEDVVCTFSNTKLSTLTVIKDTAGGNGVFDFHSNKTNIGINGDFSIDTGSINTGQAVFTLLDPGLDYTITELIPANWNLSSYICVTEGGLQTGTDDQGGTGLSGIALLPGENTTCTFVNIADGISAISKVTQGGADGDMFAFTTDLPGGGFTITTTNGIGGVSTGTVPTGTYTVTEVLAPDSPWTLVGIDCIGDAAWTSDVPNLSVEIVVATGQTFDCQFTNEKDGSLTISKTTFPTGAADLFAFTGTQAGSISDGQSFVQSGAPGTTFSATETAVSGWELTDINCSGVTLSQVAITGAVGGTDATIFEPGDDTASVMVAPGENVDCEFTNTKLAKLTVVKHVTALTTTNPVVLDFDFTSNVPGNATFTLTPTDPANDAQIVFSDLTPGTFSVGENPPGADGWALTGASCAPSGDPITAIVLAPGDEEICTFTNSPLGSTTIIKNTVGGDDTFAFTGDDPMGVFNLDTTVTPGSASIDFTNILPAGIYNVVEDQPLQAGWMLTAVDCVDDSTQNSSGDLGTATGIIDVDLDETVTCTFENTKDAVLVIEKNTLPIGATDSFDFTSFNDLWDGAGIIITVLLDGESDSITAQPQTQRVEEGLLPGWVITDISCTSTGQNSTWKFLGATDVPTDGFEAGDNVVEVIMAAGETVTCPFENTKEGSLTIVKDTVGGDGQFSFGHTVPNVATPFVIDTAVLDNKLISDTLLPGTYTTTETVPTGWDLTGIVCTGATDSTITIGASSGFITGDTSAKVDLLSGEDIICTFTNTKRASLELDKTVVIDHGGTAIKTDWTLSAAGPTSPLSGAGGVAATLVLPGTYILSETTGPAGYTPGAWSCTAGTLTVDSLVLAPGDVAVCTIINDDDAASLSLVKTVTNDDGGTAGITEWDLTASGPTTPLTGAGGFAATPVSAGTYILSESAGPAGYTPSAWSCTGGVLTGNSLVLLLGETAVCTIDNDDVAPQLTLVKSVTNDNGGNAQPDDFLLTVETVIVTSGAKNTYMANAPLVIDEVLLTGYTFVSITGDAKCPASPGGTVTLAPGDDITCTITNDDVAPQLTLVKTVTNDDGGNALPDDFLLTVGGASVSSGVKNAYAANTPLAIDETLLTGYTFVSIAGDAKCPQVLGGTVTLDPGDDISCTITNDDVAPQLTLVKSVTNDNGGVAQPDDFLLTVGGAGVNSGLKYAYMANTPLAIDETQMIGYTFVSITGDAKCPAILGGTVTMDEGDDITCTITNDDAPPGLTLVKSVTNDNGGTAVITDWTLSADGPTPITGVSGSIAVTNASVHAGDYTLSEAGGPTGYTAGNWFCEGDNTLAGNVVTIGSGAAVLCTIVNDDDTAVLTLIKTITNDDEGTAVETDWTLNAAGPTPLTGANATPAVTAVDVDAGVYTLSETNGPTGYLAGAWSCTAGSLVVDQLTLGNGETAVCTINNDDEPAAINLAKTVNGPASLEADGTYTVVYTIVASNSGNGPGSYDLFDTFSPGAGITLTAGTPPVAAYVAGTENDQSGTLGTYQDFVKGEGLAAGMNESWTVTANFTIDPALTTPVTSACATTGSAINTGFYNLVTGSTTDTDLTDNDACTDLPQPGINLAKTVNGPAVRQPGGTYTVVYTITATNTGQGPGVYDLIDAFTPGVGITLDTADAVYLAGTESDQSGTLGTYPNFVTGEALAAGKDESWTVTAIFTIDLALVTAEGNDCDDTNAGGENTGFTNGVTGSSTDTDLTDNTACTEFIPPAISLDKTSDVPTYDMVGDVINYSYLITNLGPDVLDPGLSSVVDDKETVTCPAAAPMLVGGTVTCTASHVITQADLDAGFLTNVATAMVDDVTSNDDTVTVTATILPPMDPVIPVPVNDKLALLLLTLMLLLTGWYYRPVAMRKF